MALMPIFRPSWLASAGLPDYVRDPKTVSEIEGEGEEEPVHKEGEEEHVHKNKDKGKGVVIEEGGDGEGANWVDWDRENAEWVADSKDDLYDGEDSVDYAEDDECFDANIDKDTEWAGFLQDDHEDEMRWPWGEIKKYLDAVRDPKTVAEIEGEGEEEPVRKEGEEEHVHKNKDKGKAVVIEEGGDGEGADWVDWDRENAEWVADSKNDLYDGEDSVDYAEDDECFDANIDKDDE
ncbi:hypothetical protein Salat_0166600 [Sesamum alatum]|uniref:Uncharacterized protein n=1 Tax=Sesamum alatum TaxID=300844 RepID=A0AAE1YYG8_9LAMI|nr:hypothetical protein Salat_0166600 [Sesamum alatum]